MKTQQLAGTWAILGGTSVELERFAARSESLGFGAQASRCRAANITSSNLFLLAPAGFYELLAGRGSPIARAQLRSAVPSPPWSGVG